MVNLFVNTQNGKTTFFADWETGQNSGISGISDENFVEALLQLSYNIKKIEEDKKHEAHT